jgi:hypothetical protein
MAASVRRYLVEAIVYAVCVYFRLGCSGGNLDLGLPVRMMMRLFFGNLFILGHKLKRLGDDITGGNPAKKW